MPAIIRPLLYLCVAAACLISGTAFAGSPNATNCARFVQDTYPGTSSPRFMIRNRCGAPIDLQTFFPDYYNRGHFEIGSTYWDDAENAPYSPGKRLVFRDDVDLGLQVNFTGPLYWFACHANGDDACNKQIACVRSMWDRCYQNGCTAQEFKRVCGFDLTGAASH